MSESVLDASAILAAVLGEPGGQRVLQLVAPLVVSAVNFAEVGTKLSDLGHEPTILHETLSMLGLQVIPFDAGQAVKVADLWADTKSAGLSLGDRACIVLAASRGAVAITADNAWANLTLPAQIELVR